MFVNGLLKAASEAPTKQKRWTDTRGILTPAALFHTNNNANSAAPNTLLPASPTSQPPQTQTDSEEEHGDMQSKEDKEYRAGAEKEKWRVAWNVERKCFLSQAATGALREQVIKSRYWPLEVIRSAPPTGAAGGKVFHKSYS